MRRIALLTALVALAAGALAVSSASGNSVTAACAATPLMNNVPRGGEFAVEWQLCVLTDRRGNWQAFVHICGAGASTTSCAGGRCNVRIPARLHVELSLNGPSHAIANSREFVLPTTCKSGSFISTRWHARGGGGWFCSTLWNHDELGYYAVVPGEVSLGGDKEHFATDATHASRARSARVPHQKAASKWNSVCLGW